MSAYLPTTEPFNNAEWKAARKRAISCLDHVCAICGKDIDTSLPRKDPDTGAWNGLAVEVDHKDPRSRGGALYELDNLQLTHSVCNRKKGARMASDYLDETVINPIPLSNAW